VPEVIRAGESGQAGTEDEDHGAEEAGGVISGT
jgi:hypothetical protein